MRTVAVLVCLLTMCYPATAQWSSQPSGTTADLYAVHAVSEQVAWASGAHSTVLHTLNGGASWETCAAPANATDLDLRAIQGFDARTAVVMSSGQGELSRVYRTTDGCHTWELVLQNPDPDGAWDSMQFQHHPDDGARKGYFSYGVLVGHPVGGEFVLFTSKDHGRTWQAFRDDEAFTPGPSAVAKEGEYPFALGNAALTATADGDSFAFVTGGPGGGRLLYPQGEHYDFNYTAMKYSFLQLELPMTSGARSGAVAVGIRRVSADKVDMMVVGGDASRPEVGSAVFIRHGGPTLKKLLSPRATAAVRPPGGFRSAVAFDSGLNRWITVGPNGTDTSQDDGRTWVPMTGSVSEGSDTGWQALSLPFVVGPHGRVGRLQTPPTALPGTGGNLREAVGGD